MVAQASLSGVVFDVDGTLVSSERDGHRVAYNRAFEEFGLPDRWDEDHYGELLAVAGGRKRLEHYLLRHGRQQDEAAELAAELHACKTRIVRDMIGDGAIPARPGVGRLLDELADRGIALAVATTGSRPWVEPLLERLFGHLSFEVVLTGSEVPDLKPDPAVYHRVIEELDGDPDRLVVVEDSAKGVVAARGAGLACLAVANGYTREELTAQAADDEEPSAGLVVDRFGDPGRAGVLAGPAAWLEDGAVTFETLARLADARPAPNEVQHQQILE